MTEWDPDDDEAPPDTAAVEEAYEAAGIRIALADAAAADRAEEARALAREDAREDVAYHEAGHAVAAEDCVQGWEAALIDGDRGWVRPVAEHHDGTTPANRAYFLWAGCWTQARYLSPDDPWAVLPGLQAGGGWRDMERVKRYWDNPAHAPHETEEQWARSLDSLWKRVEAVAAQIYRERVVKTPLHPDWKG